MKMEFNQKGQESEKSEVAWNLSQALISEIQNLLLLASSKYNRGEIQKAFYYMKSVKLRFIQSLDKTERNALKKIELSFIKLKLKYYGRDLSGRQSSTYEFYTEKIMDLLNDYGYLVPLKKSSHKI